MSETVDSGAESLCRERNHVAFITLNRPSALNAPTFGMTGELRALIIDKDNAPRWNPERLQEVTEASVDAFFPDRWRSRSHPLSDLERTSFHG